ncbi:MAG: DUF4340 domain-containing protein [bacterium]|nr:DUF4340 domain-containing protein [bacterium]
MRIARRNWALSAALVALLGAQLALHRGGAEERAVEALFAELEGASVARIVVEAEGEALELERDADGLWGLTGFGGYPGRAEAIDRLVDRLRSITTLDLLSEEASSHGDYGVDEQGTRVRLYATSREPVATIVQGGESRDGRATYLRREDSPAVYRAPNLRRITTGVNQWIDPRLVTFQPALVESIRLEGSALGAPLVVSRDANQIGKWTTQEDANVPGAAVRSFLKRAQGLFLDDVEGTFDPVRFGPDRLRFTLLVRGGSAVGSRLGAEAEQGRTLATSVDGAWTVVVKSSAAELLIDAATALR